MEKKITKLKKLEGKIREHKALYYQGRGELLDEEYDELEDQLRSMNPQSHVLNLVGTKKLSSSKVKHKVEMLSLDKTVEREELDKWIGDRDVISMYKIDGSSCSLIYREGKFCQAKTRGDGFFGEDITKNIEWIGEIPKQVKMKNCEIRGEVYCKKDNFFKLSQEMKDLELDIPRSQRNIVAGLIGRKDNIEFCRYLSFFAFDIISNEIVFKTEKEKIDYIKNDLKFFVPKTILHKKKEKIDKVIEATKSFITKGGYLIDGLVFSYNDLFYHKEMGHTAHHPRYRMAFKFKGKAKRAKIKEIIWSVSRNGHLVPVANIEPIELSGATVSRVTLHNYRLVTKNRLKKDDEINIVRSGEVIPKFIEVLKSSSKKFEIPKRCPSCNKIVQEEDVHVVCPNKDCPDRKREEILDFIHKIGIQGFSIKRLRIVMDAGLVQEIPDLYRLKVEDLMSLERTKEKLANGIILEIEKSKRCSLVVFLSALGISGGAYNKCKKIVQSGFNTIDKIKNLSVEGLCQIESFAEKSAEVFINSLSSRRVVIHDLLRLGFDLQKDNFGSGDLALFGKNIVLTGKLSRNRLDIEKEIRENGGSLFSSVSKKVDYLVINDKDSQSSKAKKAREMGVPMISEEEFFKLW